MSSKEELQDITNRLGKALMIIGKQRMEIDRLKDTIRRLKNEK